MSDEPPRPASPVRQTAVRAARAGFSLVWLVPIVALVATLALAWNAYAGRGELISVEFSDATGIVPGETTLRFREIPVGRVESVRFTEDLQSVVVDIRVDADIAPYIDAEAEFWIVRPIVSAQGISRLDTVLSGIFIEGFWDAEPGEERARFVGLDRPSSTRSSVRGTRVVLSSPDARGLSEGAPVTFRGLEVGRMQNLRLSEQDETVHADVFIQAPHDQRLSSATVFWDKSGLKVALGTRGVDLEFDSLATLVQGGVAFANFSGGGEPVAEGHVFRLQPDEDAARASLFGIGADDLRLTIFVDGPLGGLAVDDDVRMDGMTVGRVTELGIARDPSRPEGQQTVQRITFAVAPGRLGLEAGRGRDEALTFLQQRVAEGLRARVASSGLLGTATVVELFTDPAAPPAQLIADAEPHPVMPAAPSQLSDLSASAEGLMSRLGNLRIEELLQSATDMLDSITQIAASPDTRALPQELRGTVDEARLALTEIRQATQDIRGSGALDSATAALADIRALAEKLNTAADAIPPLLGSARQAADGLAAVDYGALGGSADAALADLRAILSQEAAQALPQDLRRVLGGLEATLTDVQTITGALTESGSAQELAAGLAEARALAAKLNTAADDIPPLLASARQLADRAGAVDFAGIGGSASAALADLRAILSQEAAQALPQDLRRVLGGLEASLADIQAMTGELREAGSAEILTRMLLEAEAAAEAVRVAAIDVPDMIDRIDSAAESVDEFAFGEISAQAEGILADLRAMLGSEDAEQLPRNLSDTLQSASALLNELREGGASGNLNAALVSARSAADEVAAAARTLPDLSTRFQQLAQRTESVIGSYGEQGQFNAEARTMIRELARAASAFGSLARTIERNPRAFILGR